MGTCKHSLVVVLHWHESFSAGRTCEHIHRYFLLSQQLSFPLAPAPHSPHPPPGTGSHRMSHQDCATPFLPGMQEWASVSSHSWRDQRRRDPAIQPKGTNSHHRSKWPFQRAHMHIPCYPYRLSPHWWATSNTKLGRGMRQPGPSHGDTRTSLPSMYLKICRQRGSGITSVCSSARPIIRPTLR